MKQFRLIQLLPALAAGLLLAAPATSLADRKVTVYRDNDGDGHYNKKTYHVDKNRYYGGRYYDNRYYGNRYYNNHYYRPGSYGYSYGSYYRRPYYYSNPTLSFSYSRPVYSPRSSYYADDLVVDVQRELRRRGYYRGSIDGDAGPGTRAAIRAYQDDRGLSVTGRIDRSLLRALGVG